MIDEFGFEASRRSRSSGPTGTMSNLDDMHENGIHDYLKYVKFGYGRGTDHACKDIRGGQDDPRGGHRDGPPATTPVKPRKDLERWLDYVGMDEDGIRPTLPTASATPASGRSDESAEWVKDNIWDFDARRETAGAPA